MASDTITAGLRKYGIGNKLRRLRLRKSMGLLELSKHTGLSPALLSKLERDLMHPTLPTLLRIAMVFSVGLEYFFNPESTPVLEIIRKKDRLRFPDSPDGKQAAYYFESLDFPVPDRALNSYLAEFEPMEAEHSKLHQHPGIEFLYVLSGRLELRTAEDTTRVGGWRRYLLRLHCAARLPQTRRQAHKGACGGAGTATVDGLGRFGIDQVRSRKLARDADTSSSASSFVLVGNNWPVYAPPDLPTSHAISCPCLASFAHFERLSALCCSEKWPSSSVNERRGKCSSRSPRLISFSRGISRMGCVANRKMSLVA